MSDNWKRQRRDPRTGKFVKGVGMTSGPHFHKSQRKPGEVGRPLGPKSNGSKKRITPAEEARQDQVALPEDSGGPTPPKGLSGAKLAQWYLKNVPVSGGKKPAPKKPQINRGPGGAPLLTPQQRSARNKKYAGKPRKGPFTAMG